MILMCWRDVYRKEKASVLSVKNVLEKSMFMKGFHYIKNVSNSLNK
jgi:hypothetical protein